MPTIDELEALEKQMTEEPWKFFPCAMRNAFPALLKIAKAAQEVVEYHDDLDIGWMGELRQALRELERRGK